MEALKHHLLLRRPLRWHHQSSLYYRPPNQSWQAVRLGPSGTQALDGTEHDTQKLKIKNACINYKSIWHPAHLLGTCLLYTTRIVKNSPRQSNASHVDKRNKTRRQTRQSLACIVSTCENMTVKRGPQRLQQQKILSSNSKQSLF